jgi:hypothetical protein
MTNSGYDLTGGIRRTFHRRDRHKEAEMSSEITIRSSTKADRAQIAQLAELDSHEAPAGDAMLAFVDDQLWAAVELDSGQAIADPFHPTAELIELLRMRAGQPEQAGGIGLRTFRHAAQAA